MERTVILANGSFPKKGSEAWKLLESAKRIVACDGAANTYARRFHKAPDYIVGDLDSMKFGRRSLESVVKDGKTPLLHAPHPSLLVCVPDQDTNDLSKAISFCKSRHWRDLVIVGATGKREDHELGNIFRAMEAGVEVVTDYGRFIPVERYIRTRVGRGKAVSVFATEKGAEMSSKGLAWPLDTVKFTNLYCATLNRTTTDTFEIESSVPFFVYIAR